MDRRQIIVVNYTHFVNLFYSDDDFSLSLSASKLEEEEEEDEDAGVSDLPGRYSVIIN